MAYKFQSGDFVAAGSINVEQALTGSGTVTLGDSAADLVSVVGAASFDNNVTLGNAQSDVATVTGQLTASHGALFSNDISIPAARVLYLSGKGGQNKISSNSGTNLSIAVQNDLTLNAGGSGFLPENDDASYIGTSAKRWHQGNIAHMTASYFTSSLVGAFKGDGSGLTNINVSNLDAVGSDTQVQFNQNGEFGAAAGFTFDGTGSVASSVMVSSADLKATNLTSGRVLVAGASGILEDNANLAYNGSTLQVKSKDGQSGSIYSQTGSIAVLNAAGNGYLAKLGNDGNISGSGDGNFGGSLSVGNGIDVDGAQSNFSDSVSITGSGGVGLNVSSVYDGGASILSIGNILAGHTGGGTHTAHMNSDGEISGSGQLDIGGRATFAGNVLPLANNVQWLGVAGETWHGINSYAVTASYFTSSVVGAFKGDGSGLTNLSMESMDLTRGYVWIGDSDGEAAAVNSKTSGQILIGDGTDVNSVAVSGDVTISSAGAVTIANNAVETVMILSGAVSSVKIGDQAVINRNLGTGSVTVNAIKQGAVTMAAMATGSLYNNAYRSGSVENAHLANDYMVIGGTTVDLGDTITAITALTDIDMTAADHTILDTVGANTLTVAAATTTVAIPGTFNANGTVTLGDAQADVATVTGQLTASHGALFSNDISIPAARTLYLSGMSGQNKISSNGGTNLSVVVQNDLTLNAGGSGFLPENDDASYIGTAAKRWHQGNIAHVTASYFTSSLVAAFKGDGSGLTNLSMESMDLTRGYVWIGDSDGEAAAVDGKTSGQILIGDGTDLASVAVSGDVTLSSAGAVAIGNNKIIQRMFGTGSANANVYKTGSVENVHLENSAITIGGTSTSLGSSITALTALTDIDMTAADHTIFDTVGANDLTIGAATTGVVIPGTLDVNAIFYSGIAVLGAGANQVLTATSSYVVMNGGGSATTLKLPASPDEGTWFAIKRSTDMTATVTLDYNSGKQIDGANTIELESAGAAVTLIFDDTTDQWNIF